MNTILCATDFSPPADRALQVAAALALAQRAKLEVLHVLHMPPLPSELFPKEVAAEYLSAAEGELARRVRDLAGRGFEAAGAVRSGIVDEEIVRRAAELSAALVVVGTHNRQGLARAFLGSVAERVIRGAKSPVLAVPPTGELRIADWTPGARPLRITAGIDPSPASDAALGWLRELRGRLECQLRLVHLYWPIREHERLGLDPPDPYEPDPEAIAVLRREIQPRIASHLGDAEPTLSVRPMWGAEEDALDWEAETDDADLLVVGTSQGRGGSTAIASVRAAQLPVVCVPAPAAVEGRARAPEAMENILVTTDFSPLGNAAIPQAYRLLQRGRGTITIVHVVEPAELGLAPDRQDEIETGLLALVPRGVNAHFVRTRTLVIESGAPADAIVKAARRVGADLIVMSSHGRSGLQRAMRGSVTDQVLHTAPTPVMVVGDPKRAS